MARSMTDGMAADHNGDGPLVVDLADVSADRLAEVGGKAANLGELIRAGFDVPPGFCVTTRAYRQAVRGTTVEDGSATAAGAARSAVLDAPFPTRVAQAIRQAYARLGSGADLAVAVRSSATAEDLPSASFAGQQDTYLNVVGIDDVLDAVQRCWASLWTDRAVAYRSAQGIDGGGVALAVVVQHMVDAAVAGVLFTADTVTGRRRHQIVVRWHLAPGVRARLVPGGAILTTRAGDIDVTVAAVPATGLSLTVDAAEVAVGFGRTIPVPVLSCAIRCELPVRITTAWRRAESRQEPA